MKTTLGKQINLKRGYDLPSQSRIIGNIPIFSSSGVSGYHSVKMCDGPGVITGRYGTIGQIFFSRLSYWPLNTTLYVQDFKGNDELFVYYFLKQIDWNKYSDKSAVPGVNRNDVHQEEVVIPTLPEQKAIVAVLSSLDNKIDLLYRQNVTLEAIAETHFRQWFVVEARDDWKRGAITDLIEIKSGFAFKSSAFIESGKYKLITIKGVQDGYLELSGADKIDVIPAGMPDYCHLSKGDILLSLTGNVGRCCLVDNIDLLLNQRVSILQPIVLRDWAFAYILFRQSSTKRMLEEIAKGTAQANLSPIETGNMEISIPSIAALESFSERVTPCLKKVLCNKTQIKTLVKFRDTLLPKLMSGEVRVKH